MSRYPHMFARLGNQGAFGGFLMLGDPGIDASLEAVDALVEGGVDFLELGIPFSDPVADGPVIQASAQRALAAGVRTADCIAMIAAIRVRHPDIPIGILTYANITIARGFDRFVADLAEAGADSLLVADIPSVEAEPYAKTAKAAGLDWVMIAATNTPATSMDRIAELSSGFTYCVARAGVTGKDTTELHHRDLFDALAHAGAPPPILGFGISSPQSVSAALREGAAGAVCGSAIIDLLHQEGPDTVIAFIRSMKVATLTIAPA
nr:tryptophan synthase subunit alpha [uncultured Sphingomonas sp.]